MARNQEKSMLLLNRFYEAKKNEGRAVKVKRPFLATECDDVHKAEKWRLQIIREISRKVSQIQNPGLGEFRIRDLNDEINKLIREKSHWQERIRELGGPDYFKVGPRMLDHEGKELPGNRGYKYFGAARDLPGVRELFEQRYVKPPRKNRGELAKSVDADYYGYRDEEDGVIVPLEQEAERKAIAKNVAKWQEDKVQGKLESTTKDNEEDIYSAARLADIQNEVDSDEEVMETEKSLVAHVPVPSQEQVEEMLVRRKKMELLSTYVTESLQAQGEEAKALLGYQ
ncbi:pre-mRNA-splicing factor ISY1 homolog [Halichondria panicea]|uniref:pre-mRNA-splicing factor ISY1 homolog n=1 Tax=Halichondria panicea TaxID=6063 RepID=UPI00312B37C2